MNIPEKALDAAVKALFEDGCGEPKVDAATALEAAAGAMYAQALRDEADRVEALEKSNGPERMRAYLRAKSLRHSANRLDPQ